MSKVLVDGSSLSGIGSAIRSKNGGSTFYKPSEMAAAINALDMGITPSGTVNISQNGTVNVTQYASASVNVPNSYSATDEGKVVSNGALVAQTARASNITENGTYDTTLNNEIIVDVEGASLGQDILVNLWKQSTISIYPSNKAGLTISYDSSKASITVSGTRTSGDSVTLGISRAPRNLVAMLEGCQAKLEKEGSTEARFIIQQNVSPWTNLVGLYRDGAAEVVPTVPNVSDFFVGFQLFGNTGDAVNLTMSAHVY